MEGFGGVRIARRTIDPAELSRTRIAIAEVKHCPLPSLRARGVAPPSRHARRRQRIQDAAVIGLMTLRTSVTLVAGKPLSLACSCTEASLSAR